MSGLPIRIYHNARCSKSRAACALVAEKGLPAEHIDYLNSPPDKAQLRLLLQQLGIKPEALVRKGEAVFKTHYAGKTLSDDDWLEALASHPILIERPIVVRGDKAVIGRPLENVLALLNED